MARFLDGERAKMAMLGVAAAWAASSVGVAMMLKAESQTFQVFLRAWGAGVLLRAAVLVVLMAAVYGKSRSMQASLLGSYALGVMTLLLIEFRHLNRKAS